VPAGRFSVPGVARAAPSCPPSHRNGHQVLARANRVTRPRDFRAVVRRGRRVATANTVIHILDHAAPEPVRFGFIVTKAVGGAVTRNLVRRRLRAACFEMLGSARSGMDVVIRALPGSERANWTTLQAEIAEGVSRGATEK
jgi:ribonuclease P protein component